MPQTAAHSLTKTALMLAPKMLLLVVVALGFLIAAHLRADAPEGLVLTIVGLTLIASAVLIRLLVLQHGRGEAELRKRVMELVAQDAAPTFASDAEGQVEYQNHSAERRFGAHDGQSLAAAMGDMFANPSVVLYRLQTKAEMVGHAREDVVTRRGHMRLSVHRVGDGKYLWRLEEMLDRSGPARGGERG